MITLDWCNKYKLVQEPVPIQPRGHYDHDPDKIRDRSEPPLDTPEHSLCSSMPVPMSVIEDNYDNILPYTPMNWRAIADSYLSRHRVG